MNIYDVSIASLEGAEERCEIEFSRDSSIKLTIKSKSFGLMPFVDHNLFGALIKFCLRIERDGYLLLCNAARTDAYPSRMMLQMGGGRKVYLLIHGLQTSDEDLVDVLGAATLDQVGTVKEQEIGYENWLGSLK
ncbi:hypothetical protein [Pseudoduganella chitinolytica]|uniref:Uncharacterized protein n=1 Tax=Pseudoduganella chitinolytica TaxID=34070 RepID=A0ABY8BBU1_9BURK|nr:hypothetical protein [Pseudoduganella chitinolytica]WEF32873.1 hypothetical protein PX653_26345 [Pseudoduganella chitinolytica]